MKMEYRKLKPYLLLWGTQSLSALGSAMTNYALVIWLYQKSGSALETALLSICSYAPYVLMSVFAGALSDRWDKKRTMLCCDLCAAVCTLIVLGLLKADRLLPWHMYILNAVNGLMNTVQQPASDVAATLLVPRELYQKTSGLRSFSSSAQSLLTPVFATALLAFAGLEAVIFFDLATFVLAFAAVLGDASNYEIGRLFGTRLFRNPNSKIFKQSSLEKTHAFYDKYGGKTIVIARFVPVVRTFAPFVAGMGRMSYRHFAAFNVTGGILWVALFIYAGYLFGGLDIVQRNLKLLIVAIIVLSVLPAVIEVWRARRGRRKTK